MIKFKGLLITTALFFVVSYPIYSDINQKVKVIRHDSGGFVKRYYNKYHSDTYYKIKGTCMSSCTILAFRENSCVYKTARLGFHGSWPRFLSDERQYENDYYYFGQFYPEPVKTKFLTDWRHNGINKFDWLNADQLEGLVNYCEDENE